jgi:hypothetical protein
MNIASVQQKYTDQLMNLPNVVAVGQGQDAAGNDVIKVFVERRLPESDLRPEDIVPKTLDGFRTEVETIGVVLAQDEPETHAEP